MSVEFLRTKTSCDMSIPLRSLKYIPMGGGRFREQERKVAYAIVMYRRPNSFNCES
jgi:hypothetical protein